MPQPALPSPALPAPGLPLPAREPARPWYRNRALLVFLALLIALLVIGGVILRDRNSGGLAASRTDDPQLSKLHAGIAFGDELAFASPALLAADLERREDGRCPLGACRPLLGRRAALVPEGLRLVGVRPHRGGRPRARAERAAGARVHARLGAARGV